MIDLTNEELCKIAKEGDKEAYEFLFVRNSKFSTYIAFKYDSHFYLSSLEDFESIANYGMYKAYQNFDVFRGAKFISYASVIMHNEIKMYIRKMSRFASRHVNLEDIITYDRNTGGGVTLYDRLESDICNPEKDFIENEIFQKEISLLDAAMKALSDKEIVILSKLYNDKKTQKEIGAEIGLSQGAVSRAHYRALGKLRERITYNMKREEYA